MKNGDGHRLQLSEFCGEVFYNNIEWLRPPAIEAAETMFTPEQTAQLCDDTFTNIDSVAFQAFERYPVIFKAARGRLV